MNSDSDWLFIGPRRSHDWMEQLIIVMSHQHHSSLQWSVLWKVLKPNVLTHLLLLITHKSVNSLALSSAWSHYALYPNLCTMLSDYRVQRKAAGCRAFTYRAPFLWNYLPVDITRSDPVEAFKSKRKTHLFTVTFNLHSSFDTSGFAAVPTTPPAGRSINIRTEKINKLNFLRAFLKRSVVLSLFSFRDLIHTGYGSSSPRRSSLSSHPLAPCVCVFVPLSV